MKFHLKEAVKCLTVRSGLEHLLLVSHLYYAQRNKCNAGDPHPSIIQKGLVITISKNKTGILTFRVTPEERDQIERKAIMAGESVSNYLRDSALKKEIVVIDGLKDFTTELRRIGNNLNQITKAVNSGVYAVDLTETKREVQRIWQSLNSLSQEAR